MWAPSGYKIFVIQLLAWITTLLFFSFAELHWILIGLVSYVFYAGAGVALTFHRTLSHNSWKFPKPVRYFLILLASMANVGSPLTWVAVHRAHHKYCDTAKDPHSPKHNSFWFMMFGSMFAKVSVRHVTDLLRDPFILSVHRYYYCIQIPWIVFLYLAGGWMAVIACHVVPSGMTWLAGSFVNWYNHLHGYQRYQTNDTSKNSFITGFLVLGEGWHNAHHDNPIHATTSSAWYEIDTIYYIAKLLGGKPTIKV